MVKATTKTVQTAQHSFKNSSFVSKQRVKTKGVRFNKNLKSLMVSQTDLKSLEENLKLDAGPSTVPARKYCDFTGFESNYQDKRTGLRYFDKHMYEVVEEVSDPVKEAYLALRNALISIK